MGVDTVEAPSTVKIAVWSFHFLKGGSRIVLAHELAVAAKNVARFGPIFEGLVIDRDAFI